VSRKIFSPNFFSRYLSRSFFRWVFIVFVLLAIPVGVYLVRENVSFFKYATGRKADIFIDMGRTYEEKRGAVWKNLAQGGEEKEHSLSLVTNEIRQLDVDYIRIDHIYDYYDVVKNGSDGSLSFDWSKLDVLVNDILSSGAKPFFSLSYTPRVFSRSGSEVDLPKNWFDWEQLVQSTVEHYSGKDGLDIPDVYYEVWNEPDLFGNFKIYGEKNYLDLYMHTLSGIERAQGLSNFFVGGPATTALYDNWTLGLIKFCEVNNLRLDFISWHSFGKDINNLELDTYKLRRRLSYYPTYFSSQLVISEIGINSEKDPSYDSLGAAIHTIVSACVLETAVDRMFTFEIKDGPYSDEKNSGSWGILTNEKYGGIEKKPRYRALLFLNTLRGKRVNLVNDGTWVKAMGKLDGNTLRFLVVNYDPLGKHSEAVPIKIVNLADDNFIYRRINFEGKAQQRNIVVKDNEWETVEYFGPNTASIFELEFQK
jgi:hypothetical protein